MTAKLQSEDAGRLQECLAGGGVAVFPTDTVYGLCCDPENEQAARRLYALKGRPRTRAAAVMFFALEPALATLAELRDSERLALQALLPGPVTVLLANRAGRFQAACRTDPATLGLRVPRVPDRLAALEMLSEPVMQSSANLSGQPDARALSEVPRSLLDDADLVLDGGELSGVPSTVLDLRDFDAERRWHVLREGALTREDVQERLGSFG
ncbi:MAG TPA: L-threonylcarbamoyladenylate synthase [Solirubrobacteraceae bacterium]|nr:L-threonylcarbamoyladenylate synthase [Solirubrobacteraceae bacterium]